MPLIKEISNIDSDAKLVLGQDILYAAQNSIDLTTGFEVPFGADFEAIIDYCVPAVIANAVMDQPQDNLSILVSGFIGKINKTFSMQSELQIKIFGSKRKEIISGVNVDNVEVSMLNEISKLEQGIYFLNVSNGTDEINQKFLIVE